MQKIEESIIVARWTQEIARDGRDVDEDGWRPRTLRTAVSFPSTAQNLYRVLA